jgi:hypothetical protein
MDKIRTVGSGPVQDRMGRDGDRTGQDGDRTGRDGDRKGWDGIGLGQDGRKWDRIGKRHKTYHLTACPIPRHSTVRGLKTVDYRRMIALWE